MVVRNGHWGGCTYELSAPCSLLFCSGGFLLLALPLLSLFCPPFPCGICLQLVVVHACWCTLHRLSNCRRCQLHGDWPAGVYDFFAEFWSSLPIRTCRSLPHRPSPTPNKRTHLDHAPFTRPTPPISCLLLAPSPSPHPPPPSPSHPLPPPFPPPPPPPSPHSPYALNPAPPGRRPLLLPLAPCPGPSPLPASTHPAFPHPTPPFRAPLAPQ